MAHMLCARRCSHCCSLASYVLLPLSTKWYVVPHLSCSLRSSRAQHCHVSCLFNFQRPQCVIDSLQLIVSVGFELSLHLDATLKIGRHVATEFVLNAVVFGAISVDSCLIRDVSPCAYTNGMGELTIPALKSSWCACTCRTCGY